MRARTIAAAIACVGLACTASSLTIQTFGEGSAVTSIDRTATFDRLDWTHNGTSLSDYTENGLIVGTSGDSFAGLGPGSPPFFDPFHLPSDPATQGLYYPEGGSMDWVTIETTHSDRIYGVEFLYGNGWTTGDLTGVPWGNNSAYVEWRSLLSGSVVSFGQVGPDPLLPVGTVLGFSDADGFDQLQVRCLISTAADPNLQALALDNLDVQLTPVPEPATLCFLGLGLAMLVRRGRGHT